MNNNQGVGLCTDGFHSKFDGEAYENDKLQFPLREKNSGILFTVYFDYKNLIIAESRSGGYSGEFIYNNSEIYVPWIEIYQKQTVRIASVSHAPNWMPTPPPPPDQDK